MKDFNLKLVNSTAGKNLLRHSGRKHLCEKKKKVAFWGAAAPGTAVLLSKKTVLLSRDSGKRGNRTFAECGVIAPHFVPSRSEGLALHQPLVEKGGLGRKQLGAGALWSDMGSLLTWNH